MFQCPVCEKVGSMKNHQLLRICSLGVAISAFLGCASKNNYPPYPVYPQQYQQAYPYSYAGQAGGQPIQTAPMVGQPPMGQPPMGQPQMVQPVYPPQQFQAQPYYGVPPNQTGTPMLGQ